MHKLHALLIKIMKIITSISKTHNLIRILEKWDELSCKEVLEYNYFHMDFSQTFLWMYQGWYSNSSTYRRVQFWNSNTTDDNALTSWMLVSQGHYCSFFTHIFPYNIWKGLVDVSYIIKWFYKRIIWFLNKGIDQINVSILA